MKIEYLNKDNFDAFAFNNDKTVLIEFHADWCKYCKIIDKAIDSAKNEDFQDVVLGRIDIDEEPEITKKYNIEAVPTFMLIKNGKIIIKRVVISIEELKQLVKI